MSMDITIVDLRKDSLDGIFDNSNIFTTSYKYIKNNYKNLSNKELLNYLKSNNSVDKINQNSNLSKCINIISLCDDANDKKELLDYFNDKLLPKIKNLKNTSNDYINLDTKTKLIVADRILYNDKKLNSRFNFDKIAFKNNNIYETVQNMCELIDTYTLSEEAKFNIALENIIYSFHKNGIDHKQEQIIEAVQEYFLYRDNIIKDSTKESYEKILSNNILINELNCSKILLEKLKSSDKFDCKINKLILKLKDKDNKSVLESIRNIKTEKHASKYIQNIVFNYQNNIDYYLLLKSIFLIPLIGKINWTFIAIELRQNLKKSSVYNKLKKEELKDIDILLSKCEDEDVFLEESSNIISNIIKDDKDIFSNFFIEEDKYLKEYNYEMFKESKDFANSDDIKDLLDKFKNDSDKSPSRFKNLIQRLYAKNPEDIIDEIPSILNVVRVGFIFSSAIIPVIGPIIAAILLLIDKLISMKINEKQAVKLHKYLVNEKDKLNKRKDKLTNPKKKSQAEEYLKCLDKCIDNVSSYIEVIDDDIILQSDSDNDFDFDFDFKLEGESNINIAINSLIESMNTINSLILSDSKILMDSILNETSQIIIVENSYKYLTDLGYLILNCPNTLNINEYCNYLENLCNTIDTKNSINIKLALKKLNEECLINESNQYIQNIFIEQDCLMELQKIIEEGVNINTIKLAAQNFKKKIQRLSTKEKSIWQSLDVTMSALHKSMKNALTSDRREGIIKGSVIPSFSKCIKLAIGVGAVGLFTGPIGAVISAFGIFASSKILNDREKQLLYDEIDTELQVVEKQIDIVQNDGDMNQYRFLLQYQKKLLREKQRIKYNMNVRGKNIPDVGRKDD